MAQDTEILDNICIVLVAPSHPGNIGACARAMRTMGLRELRLVRPAQFPSAEATARASGADDVLANARICGDLAAAVADCTCVIATSARSRSLPWPELLPDDAADRLVKDAMTGRAAVVFGCERSGLDNDDLAACEAMIQIPTASDFSSLNLASAVQLVCYEIRKAATGASRAPEGDDDPRAAHEEMQRFYEALEHTLIDVSYLDPDNPRLLMARLRRLFNRARISLVELKILRGILTAVRKARIDT